MRPTCASPHPALSGLAIPSGRDPISDRKHTCVVLPNTGRRDRVEFGQCPGRAAAPRTWEPRKRERSVAESEACQRSHRKPQVHHRPRPKHRLRHQRPPVGERLTATVEIRHPPRGGPTTARTRPGNADAEALGSCIAVVGCGCLGPADRHHRQIRSQHGTAGSGPHLRGSPTLGGRSHHTEGAGRAQCLAPHADPSRPGCPQGHHLGRDLAAWGARSRSVVMLCVRIRG
jgi:hypothetical protein